MRALKLEAREMRFFNGEGREEDYNFTLPNRLDKNGVVEIIRARSKEDKIGFAIGSSIYDVFDQIGSPITAVLIVR